jgi:NADPH:quinone reductase-like Zn-dependent oxidoreductase
MEAQQAIPIPARLDWVAAAAMPVGMLVAYDALVTYGKLKAGEWVLLLGASAGTAVSCLQLAKLLGARTLGTSGSDEKLQRLRNVGLDVGIRTRAPDFAAQVRAATGGDGADLALNFVGGTYVPEILRALARKGRMAIVGYVDHTHHADVDLRAVHANRLEIFGLSNSKATPEERAQTARGFKRDLLPLYDERGLQPVVDRVFDFRELAVAKAYMESDAAVGKIVVKISDAVPERAS